MMSMPVRVPQYRADQSREQRCGVDCATRDTVDPPTKPLPNAKNFTRLHGSSRALALHSGRSHVR